jgi:hypothetical protein
MPELTIKLSTEWSGNDTPFNRASTVAVSVANQYVGNASTNVVRWSSEIVHRDLNLLAVDVVVRYENGIPNSERGHLVRALHRDGTRVFDRVSVYGFEERP